MARLLNRLLLIALAKGKLPMNEYAVVKEQAKGGAERTPFTHRPETVGVSTLLRKKFFQFFDGKVQGFGNSLMACPFQPADLPGGQATEHMKPKTPFLDFCKYARSKQSLQCNPGIAAVLYFCRQFLQFFFQWPGRAAVHFL